MADDEAPAPDPRWLVLQKKIFGRYVAQQLRQAGIKAEVKDIVNDLKDSVLLIQLTEVLSGESFGPKPKASNMRIQQIDNANKAMAFVKKVGIKSKASPEDIVDGNAKFVLGLIFAIIIKYMKLDEDDAGSSDIREALLLWLKNKTAGYKGVSIDNFTKSFHDGLAFCALLHKMRPKLVNYDSLDAKNKKDNLNLALDVAEKYAHVEKYLDAGDIVELDEIGMIVYLYDWYYGVSLLQKQDVAARRIGKLADMTKLHDQMRADYKSGSSDLVKWVDGKITELNDRSIDNTMAGIRSKLENFYSYKSKTKGEKIVAQLDLIALFDDLALRLRNNKRPPFEPEMPPKFLEEKFQALEKAEAECSVFLHTELDRQIRLDKTAKRYRADIENVENWIKEKMNYMNAKEEIDSVDIATYKLDLHGDHERDIQVYKQARYESLEKVQKDLANEKYEHQGEMDSITSSMKKNMDGLEAAGASKRATLQGELDKQKKINDDLCKEFAAAAKAFTDWLNGLKEKVNDKGADNETLLKFVIGSLEDEGTPKGLTDKVNEVDSRVQARLITINPYTNTTAQDCVAQWNQFKLLLQKKKALLEQEIENAKRSGLTEEQIKEVNDNFDYFDKDKSGMLERRELRGCLQSLGEDATPADVSKILTQYDKDKSGTISKDEFVNFMLKKLGDSNTEEEILEGFKLLSLEKETIDQEHLDAVVNELTFKSHHVEYLTKEMSKSGNAYDYKKWTKEVFER